MRNQLPAPTGGKPRVETGSLRIGDEPTGFYMDFIDAELFANALRAYLTIHQERFSSPHEQALYALIHSMEKLIHASIHDGTSP